MEDKIDLITMDVPLFLRILEYSKEDAKTDMDLHFVLENIIKLSKENSVLNMDNYNKIVNIKSSNNKDNYNKNDMSHIEESSKMSIKKLVESTLFEDEDYKDKVDMETTTDGKFKVGDFITGGNCNLGKIARIYQAFGKDRLEVHTLDGITIAVPDGCRVVSPEEVKQFLDGDK